MSPIRIIFFGTPNAAQYVLEELLRAGVTPNMIVTAPDQAKGRGLELTPPPVKIFAEKKGVPVFQPEKIDDSAISIIKKENPDLFIVAAYGKILPEILLAIPRLGTLNIHPSLLPKYRGASPVRDAILSGDQETGVTIILLDTEVDHGPIVAQKTLDIQNVPKACALEEKLFHMGGVMLAGLLPDFVKGKITPVPQDHARATFTKKWKKEDGLVDIAGNPIAVLRHIRACDGWPGAYFFIEQNGPKAPAGTRASKKIRVGITDAHIENDVLTIDRVIPEGKREMSYEDFLRGLK